MEIKTKHTPGPWEVSGPSGAYPWERYAITGKAQPDQIREDGHIIRGRPVTIARVQAEASKATTDANARLIKEAPNLLAALVDLVENMEAKSGLTDFGSHDFHKDTAQARKAIAEATGE